MSLTTSTRERIAAQGSGCRQPGVQPAALSQSHLPSAGVSCRTLSLGQGGYWGSPYRHVPLQRPNMPWRRVAGSTGKTELVGLYLTDTRLHMLRTSYSTQPRQLQAMVLAPRRDTVCCACCPATVGTPGDVLRHGHFSLFSSNHHFSWWCVLPHLCPDLAVHVIWWSNRRRLFSLQPVHVKRDIRTHVRAVQCSRVCCLSLVRSSTWGRFVE